MMTVGEFALRVCDDFDGHIWESPIGSLGDSQEGITRLRWLVRTDEHGKRRVAPIPDRMTPQTVMTDDVLRSCCVQLGIDPAKFGV